MLCLDVGHEVVTDTVTVARDNGDVGRQAFRVAAPSGKVPISGGCDLPYAPGGDLGRLLGSYPDGDEWVFVFLGYSGGSFNVNLSVVCLSV